MKKFFAAITSVLSRKNKTVASKPKECELVKNGVLLIERKNAHITVMAMHLRDLDKKKLSKKFLQLNLPDSTIVFVKCDKDGNFELRGNKKEYRTYSANYKIIRKL